MKYIVAKIHNNSLGKVQEVATEQEGIELIRQWTEEQLERPLNDDEIEMLENRLEIYNEEDMDNVFCFSLGIVE